jgi:hypothetical protein
MGEPFQENPMVRFSFPNGEPLEKRQGDFSIASDDTHVCVTQFPVSRGMVKRNEERDR